MRSGRFLLSADRGRGMITRSGASRRARLGFDGKLLGAVSRLFVDSVLGWYRRQLRTSPRELVQSGAVMIVQRASNDLKRESASARPVSGWGVRSSSRRRARERDRDCGARTRTPVTRPSEVKTSSTVNAGRTSGLN